MHFAGQDTKPGLPNRKGAARAKTVVGVAEEVGLLADKALRDGAAGEVMAVFERSLYVTLDSRWICVGETSIGSGPLHLLGNFRRSGLSVGDPARIADSTLWIAGVPLAALADASVWTPADAPRWSAHSLSRGLDAVDRVWNGALIAEGLAAAGSAHLPSDSSALVRAAMPGLIALRNVIADDSDRVSDFRGLIGLGPGLTPSGDDLIGGALIALATLGQLGRREALWRHCRELLRDTNDISRAHLQAAALGYGAAALHAAIHATMSGEAARLGLALDALTTVGHSSGLDAFAGSLIVMRHAVRKQ